MINVARWKVIVVALATIFGIIFTLPNLLPPDVRAQMPGWLPNRTLNLGLDLQGGSSLLYEVDAQALRAEKLTNLTEDTRAALLKAEIRFTGLGVVNGEVNVRITDPAQVEAAAKVLREEVGTPLDGAVGGRDATVSLLPDQRIRIAFVSAAMESQAAKAVDQSIEVIRRRIDELGTKEPDIRKQGTGRIYIAAPGESDPQKLRDIIGKTAKLTFHMVDENADPVEAQQGRVPPGSMLVPGDDFAPYYVIRRRTFTTGEQLIDAQGTFDQQSARPVVSLRFNAKGAKAFGETTTNNVGKRFAILLDNKVIDFAATLPASLKIKNGRRKHILKETLRPLLPPGILDRRKQGFGIPLGNWFRGGLTGLFSDVLDAPKTKQRGYFEPAFVSRLLREHLAGERDHTPRLWQLLVFELWHRQYLDKAPAGSAAAHVV